jgi:hypothetical protein
MRSAALRAGTPSFEPSGVGIAPFRHHLAGMTRPNHVKAPAHLTKSPPVPKPEAVEAGKPVGEEAKLDPTRYGDWEKKGIAIDF